jgi:hypothetical protein
MSGVSDLWRVVGEFIASGFASFDTAVSVDAHQYGEPNERNEDDWKEDPFRDPQFERDRGLGDDWRHSEA